MVPGCIQPTGYQVLLTSMEIWTTTSNGWLHYDLDKGLQPCNSPHVIYIQETGLKYEAKTAQNRAIIGTISLYYKKNLTKDRFLP